MMDIPVETPIYVYGDNQSVLANTMIPDSALKKKSQSIAYHFDDEGVVRDEWCTAYVKMHDNEADLLTKLLLSGEKCKGFVKNLLHHIFGLMTRPSVVSCGVDYINGTTLMCFFCNVDVTMYVNHLQT